MSIPTDSLPPAPAAVPAHSDDCPGCSGDGYKTVVGPSTGFEFESKACNGLPVPDSYNT